MENKVIIVDRGKHISRLRLLIILVSLIFIPVFIPGLMFLGGLQESIEPSSLIVVAIVAVVITEAIFVGRILSFYGYIPVKIEYNQEEIIVHQFLGKIKFRFDEKPVKTGRILSAIRNTIGIRRPGSPFTNVIIPADSKNLDEIVALFKRIGNQ